MMKYILLQFKNEKNYSKCLQLCNIYGVVVAINTV